MEVNPSPRPAAWATRSRSSPRRIPPETRPPFTGAKITKIAISDKGTGEKDKVSEPAHSGGALGTIEVVGDITGTNSSGSSSVFSVITSAGVINVPLTPGMTRLAVLDAIATGLTHQGASSVWVDSDKLVLYVVLGG